MCIDGQEQSESNLRIFLAKIVNLPIILHEMVSKLEETNGPFETHFLWHIFIIAKSLFLINQQINHVFIVTYPVRGSSNFTIRSYHKRSFLIQILANFPACNHSKTACLKKRLVINLWKPFANKCTFRSQKMWFSVRVSNLFMKIYNRLHRFRLKLTFRSYKKFTLRSRKKSIWLFIWYFLGHI